MYDNKRKSQVDQLAPNLDPRSDCTTIGNSGHCLNQECDTRDLTPLVLTLPISGLNYIGTS